MGNKNKTISFRVNEDKFRKLKEVADERDLSLSAVFREYVDTFVAHDGKVRVVPEHEVDDSEETDPGQEFPPKVEVPKSFVREHERLELEAEHLRDQLEEYKQYVTHLRSQIDEESEDGDDVIRLEDLDGEDEDEDRPFRIG